jgi:hypothetical protein
MATLQSPGVSISVIDESFYTPAGAGTVPMIFVATGQDKANGSGTGTAQGTTAANAGKVWVITSQRDLSDTFGVPYFETDAEGNPVHGGELNEYGLQAAYSALGVSSKAYVVRADVDTSKLVPNAETPGGMPVNGTYWLVTADSTFGIQEWNASTGKFTNKTPLLIDNSNFDTDFNQNTNLPNTEHGHVGDYLVVVTSDNNANGWQGVYYKSASLGWVRVNDNFDGGKKVRLSPHYEYPDYTSLGLNAATGSVWIKTTTPGKGADWDFRVYSSSADSWNRVSAPLFSSTQEAISELDGATGGRSIEPGSLAVVYDTEQQNSAGFKAYIRYKSSPTTITISNSGAYNQNWAINIRETDSGGSWSSPVSINGSASSVPLGQMIAEQISAQANLEYTKATWEPSLNRLTITHELGGEIEFEQTQNQPMIDIGLVGDAVANLYMAPAGSSYDYVASNWKPLVFEALATAPTTSPDDGQLWFDNNLDADIMYNNGTSWVGYLTAFPSTDPLGPTISASKPTTQQDGATALANGDIWIDTSNPDQYGRNIYVYDGNQFNLVDVTDSTSPDGWVFADARWGLTGADDMKADIANLLASDYVDPDCPNPRLYPRGTRLFNTRRSGNNVKKFHANYIDTLSENARYNNESMVDYMPGRWVTASPNADDGAGQFGRLAQRSVVVHALKGLVTANTAIRDTDTLVFNLITCPGYPELMQNMVEFNTDRGLTAIVLGDTPFRLPANGTALTNYGMNTATAVDNNDTAAVTYDTGLAMFYPSGYTNDNLGNAIVVPPSHAMLRTILNSDNKSYPWFAPAGTRRGVVDNVSSVGYVDGVTGEFKTASLHQGLRDVLAGVKINPIATLPGVGIVNMGQYTRAHVASALDRINVSRLVAHLRYQLAILVKPFLFEPNDAQTRHEVKSAVDALLSELVSQRALYDFLTVCDSTNNTPARIDRSELWVDIAIEPVKAVEFIYIPLRIMNTGAIAAMNK